MQKKEILLEHADKLRQLKTPAGWEVAGIEVSFKKIKPEYPIHSTYVVYDAFNDKFYTKNDRVIIYPEDVKDIKEALVIMKKANDIIKE